MRAFPPSLMVILSLWASPLYWGRRLLAVSGFTTVVVSPPRRPVPVHRTTYATRTLRPRCNQGSREDLAVQQQQQQRLLPSSLGSSTTPQGEEEDRQNEDSEKKSLRQSIQKYFAPPDDGLTFRQRLGKLGLAVVLSYGWVSNMSYCVTVSLAWYIFSKQTGKSPLVPGQWKGFLAVYAGFWVFNNIIRPIRLTVSVAISPQFDKVVTWISDQFRVSRAAAIGITVVLANLIGTTAIMCAGIFVAAALAGVPVFPPK